MSERDLRKLDAKRLRSMCVEEYDMLPPALIQMRSWTG